MVVSGTTSGVEDGQTVTVTLSDGSAPDVVVTATVTGNAWTAAAADISGLDNGPISVTADVSDLAGNPASDSESVTLDNVAPTIAITTPIAGNDVVNASEDNTVVVSGTTSGVEDGQTVTVTLSDGSAPDVVVTATVTGNAWTASAADISGLDNGPISVTADVSDLAGNPASDSESVTLDNVAPTIAITTPIAGNDVVNASEDNTVVVSGTTSGVEDGQTVTVTLSDGSAPDVVVTATVTGNAWTASAADISGLDNGPISVTADVSDLAGNPARRQRERHARQRGDDRDHDADRGQRLVNASEDNTVVVSGTTSGVEDGQTVTVTFDDSAPDAGGDCRGDGDAVTLDGDGGRHQRAGQRLDLGDGGRLRPGRQPGERQRERHARQRGADDCDHDTDRGQRRGQCV